MMGKLEEEIERMICEKMKSILTKSQIRQMIKMEIARYDKSRDAHDKIEGYRHKHEEKSCPIQPVFNSMAGKVWSEEDDMALENCFNAWVELQSRIHLRTPGGIVRRLRDLGLWRYSCQ